MNDPKPPFPATTRHESPDVKRRTIAAYVLPASLPGQVYVLRLLEREEAGRRVVVRAVAAPSGYDLHARAPAFATPEVHAEAVRLFGEAPPPILSGFRESARVYGALLDRVVEYLGGVDAVAVCPDCSEYPCCCADARAACAVERAEVSERRLCEGLRGTDEET